jgi:hypothetical protein
MFPLACEGSRAPRGAFIVAFFERDAPNDVGRSPHGAPRRQVYAVCASLTAFGVFWLRAALSDKGLTLRVNQLLAGPS